MQNVVMLTVIYADCHLCWMVFMLCVASVVMLDVIMLNVVAPENHVCR